YGRLSVMLQSRFDAVSLFDVSPEAFDPAPKVWSAIVRLTPLSKVPDIDNARLFEQVVTQAFSQRRKTLRNSLRNLLTIEQIQEAGCNASDRPETLSVAQFASLSNLLTEQ
ncbi:MAG: rRNA adenine N-6-methyltransferase family protein, partial [Pseudomonadota bacterium]